MNQVATETSTVPASPQDEPESSFAKRTRQILQDRVRNPLKPTSAPLINQLSAMTHPPIPIPIRTPAQSNDEEFPVLVINSSHEMAKEITLELTLGIPGCSIMYAPTIELAKWIIKRRSIRLIVSSPILPDGSVERLKIILESIPNPPDLVIMGDKRFTQSHLLHSSKYVLSTTHNLSSSKSTIDQISSLGADIRNDLNNPLQEIVAMVYVAQQSTGATPLTDQALGAIDRAAQKIAAVVSGLEEKIRDVVG